MRLLDTTLRDGSYLIDFQFTARDTAIIASKLDDANVSFIEVGHGLGLHAGTRDNMRSAVPDEAYLEAASSAVKINKWGMFFIPGIGRLEDIELASRYSMNFIRIGMNVTETDSAESFIRKAKECGMFVSVNLMKTYALSPNDVGKLSVLIHKWGADMICVVDSAGGMFPEDVAAYFYSIKKYTDISIGFHGHNNLGLAISNTLKAVELNAEIIDCSVRGIGRSAGNCCTEIFLLALKRKGIDLNIDITKILDLAENHIDPILKNHHQLDSIGVISGYAQFHSSYLGKILEYANRYRIDPRELIIRVSSIDKVNVPDELVDRLSKELAIEKAETVKSFKIHLPIENNIVNSQDISLNALVVAEKAKSLAKKWAKFSVFNIVQSYKDILSSNISSTINEGSQFVISSAEVNNANDTIGIAKNIDGVVDYILLDSDVKNVRSFEIHEGVRESIKKSMILNYSDIDVWSRSVLQLIMELVKGDIQYKKVLVIGNTLLGRNITKLISLMGSNIKLKSVNKYIPEDVIESEIILICDRMNPLFPVEAISNQFLIDTWLGSFDDQLYSKFHERNTTIYRPEMHHLIHAEIASLVNTNKLVNERQGFKSYEDILIAAGGVIAPRGTVIVDSVVKPMKVFGIADGRGYLLPVSEYNVEYTIKINKIESWFLQK